MFTYILLHVQRGREATEIPLVQTLLHGCASSLRLSVFSAPRCKSALRDELSDVCLYAGCQRQLSKAELDALRWAVHHRFRDLKAVRKQLVCDLTKGDESKLKLSNRKSNFRKREAGCK